MGFKVAEGKTLLLGKKFFNENSDVNAKDLGVDDKIFQALIKEGSIVEGTKEEAKKASPPAPSASDGDKDKK
jgi:hypothetical protein